MAKQHDEISENHWPGYVDALTTMLMVLTFVMMILGIAVFATSQNVSRVIIEKIAKAARIELPSAETPVEELASRVVSKLEADAETPEGQRLAGRARSPGDGMTDGPDPSLDETRKIESQAPAHAPGAPPPVQTQQRGDGFRVEFQPRATRLDEATARALAERFTNEPSWREAVRLDIRAGIDSSVPSVSDARRIAYYRAAAIRSAAIRAGVAPERIRMLVDEPGVGPATQSVRVIAYGVGVAPDAAGLRPAAE